MPPVPETPPPTTGQTETWSRKRWQAPPQDGEIVAVAHDHDGDRPSAPRVIRPRHDREIVAVAHLSSELDRAAAPGAPLLRGPSDLAELPRGYPRASRHHHCHPPPPPPAEIRPLISPTPSPTPPPELPPRGIVPAGLPVAPAAHRTAPDSKPAEWPNAGEPTQVELQRGDAAPFAAEFSLGVRSYMLTRGFRVKLPKAVGAQVVAEQGVPRAVKFTDPRWGNVQLKTVFIHISKMLLIIC
jgi:hypothetical protein